MRIKLNRSKLEGMHAMVEYLMNSWPPENKAEKLLHVLINRIKIKMRNKLDVKLVKADGYSITLSEEEALAFDIWFNQMALPESLYQYEQNVAQNLCLEIDKQYA